MRSSIENGDITTLDASKMDDYLLEDVAVTSFAYVKQSGEYGGYYGANPSLTDSAIIDIDNDNVMYNSTTPAPYSLKPEATSFVDERISQLRNSNLIARASDSNIIETSFIPSNQLGVMSVGDQIALDVIEESMYVNDSMSGGFYDDDDD